MDKEKKLRMLEQLSIPTLLCLVGLVLLLTPDTASAILGQVAGVGLLVVAAVHFIDWLVTRMDALARLPVAAVCLMLGCWLLADPLVLAAWVGRFVGVFFILRGLGKLTTGARRTPGLITTLVGVLLVLSPMITSRLVLKGIGLAMVVVGGIGLLRVIRRKPNDPDIIDV